MFSFAQIVLSARGFVRAASSCLGFSFLLAAGAAFAQSVSSDTQPQASQPVHHQLRVILDPANNFISVEDSVTLPEGAARGEIVFTLNSELTINNRPRGLRELGAMQTTRAQGINETGGLGAPKTRYSVDLPRRRGQALELSYSGMLFDPTRQTSAEYSQSFSETSGIIDSRGVYLNRGSAWVPEFGDGLVTFELSVEFADSAADWLSVSQGQRLAENTWRSDKPMEEIYLIAAAFTQYTARYDSVLDASSDSAVDGERSVESGPQPRSIEMLALLRTPDTNLAAKYLDATARALALYEPLLGAYPYSKFALVENFWETGYGMPSFTLLGEQIIRFPFIITSSYPHEILHNWWGNGVYPDYSTGNWSEGLTAYLADHLFQEVEGRGAEYRKEMLARYKNYVGEGSDFPLSEFTSRNSAASQAVGYGKTLMLWHMLRIELGDELFLEGLKSFYARYQFTRASFATLAEHFSELTERDLTTFFEQWVQRTGAPELALSVTEERDDRARLNFAQIQDAAPYEFTLPVALHYSGESEPQIVELTLNQRAQGFVADNYSSLEAVVADPYFDVFRTLDRSETPPTIGELFGAEAITFVIPEGGGTALAESDWSTLAAAFAEGVDANVVSDSEIEALPSNRSVWVLGRGNRFAQAALTAAGVQLDESGAQFSFAESQVEFTQRSTVFVGRHPESDDLALGFIDIDQAVAVSGMIEKLPHYGKYSYLSFTGDAPTNDVKGVWQSSDSPLRWLNPELDAAPTLAALPPVAPLATLPPKYLASSLEPHVSALTAEAMHGRAIDSLPGETSKGIDAAANYIESTFRSVGLLAPGGSYKQPWQGELADGRRQALSNVVGLLPGSDPALSNEPVVLGAHYDHLGYDAQGKLMAGADDNASGVAVLIEVARKLRRSFTPARPILFVAFTAEEQGLMGSEHFVQSAVNGLGKMDYYAMVNLDAVGRLEGRKLQVFGSDSAYEFPFMAQGIGFTIGVESEFPTQTIASSDHVSFLNAGVPALHLFSGLHGDYHRASDSADKLDYGGLSDVASWVEEALIYLADNRDPLRVTLANAQVAVAPQGTTARQASLGTLPDFSYQGTGIRVSGITPNSAAEVAGLRAGDILLSFAGQRIDDLQGYSNLLRAQEVGSQVQLTVLRDGVELQLRATLTSRN